MERKPKGTRKGFTTGACSAAAARAATLGLVTGMVPDEVECQLANDQIVKFTVSDPFVSQQHAHAVVIKDAGDEIGRASCRERV